MALYHIDRGDIRQAIDRCSNIWASPLGAGYGRLEHKADSLIAKFKEAGGTVERLMYEQSHRDYLRSGYPHHRLPVMWPTVTGDERHYLQSPARQNARELKLVNAAITDMQMRQRDVAALDAKYEG